MDYVILLVLCCVLVHQTQTSITNWEQEVQARYCQQNKPGRQVRRGINHATPNLSLDRVYVFPGYISEQFMLANRSCFDTNPTISKAMIIRTDMDGYKYIPCL